MSEENQRKIYKYVSPDYIGKIFAEPDYATLKFSYPSDFNDPYELFLTIDFDRDPEELAFYLDVVGDNLKYPTTCFSNSPVVAPMWAHYAQNSQGFVIEFSEAKLAEAFPDAGFEDIEYSDVPTHDLSELLVRAHQIGKFRYVGWLTRAIFTSAYFTKTVCWSYERERRMVLHKAAARVVNDIMLLDVPRSAVTAIIAGFHVSSKVAENLENVADEIGCNYFNLRVGRSSATPFMMDRDGNPFSAGEEGIREAEFQCEECREPTREGVNCCAWCQIDDDIRHNAAAKNSFRALHHFGLLEDYIKNF